MLGEKQSAGNLARRILIISVSRNLRFGRYRFKRESGAPDPDACTITLTGKHIPEAMRRALDWSTRRHGILTMPSPKS